MSDEETTISMRVLLTGAAEVVEMYAFSKAFNWKRDIEIIRPITQNAEKLMAILDAMEERGDQRDH
jgi:hypothetical protein